MDAENNYESDISESWSLIDINLNDESLIANNEPAKLKKTQSAVLENVESRKINEDEVLDFVRKNKNLKEKDSHQISDFDSDSDFDFTFKKQDTESIDTEEGIQTFQNLDNDERNDSGDTESIEILDMEGNNQDSDIERLDVSISDHFDFPTYQSDDEDSSSNNESRSNNLTVIRRKRRKFSRDLVEADNIIFSENRCMSDTEVMSNKFIKANNHPVYKHYRNNVANMALSLSVGVIFAGVACIAIGHFLGVQDAADTVVELVETLKKLQVENAALQSSMTHLKKALFTLETNSKLELPIDQARNKIACEETPKINLSSIAFRNQSEADINIAALSEISSYLNFIESLPEFQNILQKQTEVENAEIDIHRLKKRVYDHIHLLKKRKKNGMKPIENTDLLLVLKKLLVVLKTIMNQVSFSNDKVEVINERLIKLKNTINHDHKYLGSLKNADLENGVPVTELDLKKIQWTPNSEVQKHFEVDPESRLLYKFPQPQKYYDFETYLKPRGPNISLKNNDNKIVKKIKKNKIGEIEKKRNKKLVKKNRKKQKENMDKKEKKRKSSVVEKFEKKEPKCMKYANSLPSFNRTDFSPKKDIKYKRRVKKIKKLKPKKLKKQFNLKEKHVPFCSDDQCFNSTTGYWIFKLADGRKEFRRHQTLSDWQFDRAKARKDLRDIEFMNNNWQFERAKARKKQRSEDFAEHWQFKRASARQKVRNYDQTHREKFTKYNGKAFFQEKFSWI